MKEIKVNPYSVRWHPDFRWQKEKTVNCPLDLPVDKSQSITDKESYRVTLASMRGELAQGIGSPTYGSYSIKAGEKYDPDKDFSYLNRPGLTIVELDDFITYYRSNLETFDGNIREQIEKEIAKAEQMKADKQSENKDSDGGDK